MADSSQCVDTDELYSKLHRLIQARKKYPGLISDIERNKFDKEMKSFENIKVEVDNDELKDILMLNNDTRRLIMNIKNNESSFLKTEEMYLKAKKNMSAIESFLELRKTF